MTDQRDTVRRCARAAYIAYHEDEPNFDAALAWDDMGGSEPSDERAAWEIFIEEALTKIRRGL